ncbi:MAG: hypothetical protein ACR2PX_26745 [Endozoicomonas sp.]|uniref:hypothetical protein n=1 Tax=Endozoicomonas sp. TaxID=1892382 RepID=UPI003D9B4254
MEYDYLFPPANREDGKTCEGCHTLDPAKGFYGSDGKAAHGGEILVTKVPSFRNLYQKIGMFGLPDRQGFMISPTRAHQGDQIRGFGFLHDAPPISSSSSFRVAFLMTVQKVVLLA